MSGIVRSQRYEDVYWVHNDSGDTSRLFAIDRYGKTVIPTHQQNRFYGGEPVPGKEPWEGLNILFAANQDWEDITIDQNLIYIGDIGNNANDRRDLGVYILYEPNPRETATARTLGFIPIRYPEQTEYPARQWHFDCEAMFVAGEKLYFITKHRKPGKHMEWEAGANLYRLDTRHTHAANVLTRVDSHPTLTLVTGADLSPNGKHLAVVSYVGIWVMDRPGQGDQWLSGGRLRGLPLNYATTRQVEAVAWVDDDTILITNEQRDLYEVRLSDLQDIEQ